MRKSSIKFDVAGKNTRLCELARSWHTDKVPSINHHYTPYYSELLSGKNIQKILEIGIGSPDSVLGAGATCNGASLRMWSEYFLDAAVWGLDIRGDILVNEGRIKSLQCDQNSEWQLRRAMAAIGGGIDLIVDDGSHVADHMILTAKTLFPFLSPGGVYVIEDVFQRFLDQVVTEIPYECEVVEFVGGRAIPDICDDRLVVIRK